MDFQSMMETFAEAWVAANTQTPLTEAAEQGLLLNSSSLALGGQSLDMAFDTPCGRRSARDSTSSSLAMAQSSSQSSQQTTINADDESASPLTACPSFGAQTDFKSGIPSNNTLGRTSIPIHCIVERVAAPGNASVPCSSSSTSGGSGGTAGSGSGITGSQSQSQSQPTHSLSQQSSSAVTSSIASLPLPATTSSSSIESLSSCSVSSPIIEQDSYAIISSAVLFIDLVRTALLRLGYSASETVGAKGVIQIKNWKPLTFEQITDNVEATVGDILGDIASVSTLKIRLYRPRLNAAHELKDKLLQVLLAHSYSLLVNSGCPIDQQILTGLCRGRVEQEIPDDTRRRFDQWYLQQVFNHYRQIAIAAQQQQQQQQQHQSTSRRTPTHPLLVDLNSSTGEHIQHANTGNNGTHSPEKHPALLTISSPQNNQHQHQHITSVRTRIRTSFDPELELPKLHRWFSENRHPSRAQVQEYVKELNSLESRKGRKPLDINNVVYWFKNARAAHKRAELKFVGDSSAANDMVNGSHSPCKTGSDTSGKCNEESTRNGSAIDDYYSLDDGDSGESSHEATQTLDLSMRAAKKSRSESPVSNDFSINFIKQEEEAQSDNNTNNIGIKSEPLDRNDGSSDYNSVDDSDDDKEYFDNINTFPQINVNSNNNSSAPESPDGRRIRRSRTFIDPMSEVPRLEHWFSMNTHPAHSQIVRYTEELNSLPYRQKFPKLEPKNIQFWFKNRRAKFKRNLTVPSSQIHCQPSSSLNIERLIAH